MFTLLPYGCYGSTMGTKQSITMSLSSGCIIDAGGLMTAISPVHFKSINHIIITHAHYDHIKDLPPFADYLLSFLKKSVTVHLTEKTAIYLKKYIFNNVIWPDFTELPRKGEPTIKFNIIKNGESFTADGIEFLPVSVNHIVDSLGFIIRKNGITIGYSGDTFICDNFVDTVNRTKDIKAIFYELSFPDRLRKLAEISKHMAPCHLYKEFCRIKHEAPVYLFHQKPGFIDEIKSDIEKHSFNVPLFLLKQKQPIEIS